MKPYKYVITYRDRHGKVRTYFRRGRGAKVIRLPDQIDSADFERAYKAALLAAPEDTRIRATAHRTRAKAIAMAPYRRMSGVYLLLLDGEIAYIGSSRNMAARVSSHRANGRPFDQAFFIATKEEEREPLERLLIRSFRPRQNRTGLEHAGNAPVSNPPPRLSNPASKPAETLAR
jgi:hypothetical protein